MRRKKRRIALLLLNIGNDQHKIIAHIDYYTMLNSHFALGNL